MSVKLCFESGWYRQKWSLMRSRAFFVVWVAVILVGSSGEGEMVLKMDIAVIFGISPIKMGYRRYIQNFADKSEISPLNEKYRR